MKGISQPKGSFIQTPAQQVREKTAEKQAAKAKKQLMRYNVAMMRNLRKDEHKVRDSQADVIMRELIRLERCCFYQRVFVFSKNFMGCAHGERMQHIDLGDGIDSESTKNAVTTNEAGKIYGKQRETERRESAGRADEVSIVEQDSFSDILTSSISTVSPSKMKAEIEERFFHLLQLKIQDLLKDVDARKFSDDRLLGLVLMMGPYTLFVLEGPEEQIADFSRLLLTDVGFLFAEHRVSYVQNRIGETYFKDFVYRRSKPMYLNEKYPPSITNDPYLMAAEHFKIIEKLEQLCERLSELLFPRSSDGVIEQSQVSPMHAATAESKAEQRSAKKRAVPSKGRNKLRKNRPQEITKTPFSTSTIPTSPLGKDGLDLDETKEGEEFEIPEMESNSPDLEESLYKLAGEDELNTLLQHGSTEALLFLSSSSSSSSSSNSDTSYSSTEYTKHISDYAAANIESAKLPDFDRSPYANLVDTQPIMESGHHRKGSSSTQAPQQKPDEATHNAPQGDLLHSFDAGASVKEYKDDDVISLFPEIEVPEIEEISEETSFEIVELTEYPSDTLPQHLFNKVLPEVQRIELVFAATRFYIDLKEFLRYTEEMPDSWTQGKPLIWPEPHHYMPQQVFTRFQYDANLTFRRPVAKVDEEDEEDEAPASSENAKTESDNYAEVGDKNEE